MEKLLKQNNYSYVIIDCNEKDVVILWYGTGTTDANCVILEREKLKEFYKLLKDESN